MSKTIYPIIPDTDVLPLCLTGIGCTDAVMPVNCTSGEASHTFIITEDGEGSVSSGGKTCNQSKGSIMFIPAGTPYSFSVPASGWSVKWLTLSGGTSGDILGKLGFDGCVSVGGCETEEAESLFGQLMTAAEEPIPSPRLVSTLLYAFVLALRETVLQKDTETYTCSITGSVDHMNRHYSENITLERLASISGVSLQHFCRVFRSKLGMRPMEYLARKRVAQAKILLGETDGRISDIAKAVGFEDQNYFGITFKKYEGISPTEYRKERGVNEKGGN